MDKIKRNKYLLHELVWSLLILGVSLLLAAFLKADLLPYIAVLGLVLVLIHLHYSKKTYQEISDLAEKVETMLKEGTVPKISASEEGSLAILEDELGKVGIRLNEQNKSLVQDKKNLKKAIEDIFHQIRTPLTAVNIQTGILKQEGLSYKDRLDLVHRLEEESKQVQWLVEALLKLSQIDAGVIQFKKDWISCADLIKAAVKPFEISMELQDQTFEAQVGETGFTGDFEWSLEAIRNLLKNAIEHTPAGGTIRVDASGNELFTEMVISDTGPGFSKEDLARVFQRFYKGAHASSKSIGIGLSLSRAIIMAQGGSLQARNGEEGGAKFIIHFYKMIV